MRKLKNRGDAMVVVLVFVVLAAVAGGAVFVAKHNKKASDSSSTSSQSNSPATKSVNGVTFSSDIQAKNPAAFTSAQIKAINDTQIKLYGTQLFTASGGYNTIQGTEGWALEWGSKLSVTSNLKDYLSKLAKSKGGSGTGATVNSAANQTFKANDGLSYKAQCYSFQDSNGSSALYGTFCGANVQKSFVEIFAQSTVNQVTAASELTQAVSGTTLNLQ